MSDFESDDDFGDIIYYPDATFDNAGVPPEEGRRAHHNALERKRRDHIKDSFLSLKGVVPTLQGERASRALILKKACDYIDGMKAKISENGRDIEQLKAQNAQLEAQIQAFATANRVLEQCRPTSQYGHVEEPQQGFSISSLTECRTNLNLEAKKIEEEADLVTLQQSAGIISVEPLVLPNSVSNTNTESSEEIETNVEPSEVETEKTSPPPLNSELTRDSLGVNSRRSCDESYAEVEGYEVVTLDSSGDITSETSPEPTVKRVRID